MQRKLLVATRNKGKIREFADMLNAFDVSWLNLNDVGISEDVAETGDSFQANAILKAKVYANKAGLLTLADDSGLEVDALDGAPGIYTARYGGAGLTPEERYRFLLQNMRGVPWARRSARFRCVIAVSSEKGDLLASAEGICDGVIAEEPAGEGGFGYDPIFYLPDREQTMAQIPSSTKHLISHRGQALQALKPALNRILADYAGDA